MDELTTEATEISTEELLDPSTELDLSGEGLEPTTATWLISNVIVEETQPGCIRAVVTFTAQEPINGMDTFEVEDRYWTAHTNPNDKPKGRRPQDIGKSNLKRLFNTVFGTPSGAIASLEGQYVTATVREDDAGFRRIGRFKAAETPSGNDVAEVGLSL